jgi:hypothetical protein
MIEYLDFRDTRINFFKRVMSELPQDYQNSSSPRFKKAITTHLFLLYLIGLRGHEFRECPNSPLIINTSYPIVVYCPKHNKTVEITGRNYIRNLTGIPCCSNDISTQKTRETIQKLFGAP